MTNFAVRLCHDLIEPKRVALEETAEIFRRRGDAMNAEQFARKTDIGASGKADFFDAVVRVECRRERSRKSISSGAAGVDQRAVNVNQNKSNHAAKYQRGKTAARFLRLKKDLPERGGWNKNFPPSGRDFDEGVARIYVD
jgi:hypothetical protein